MDIDFGLEPFSIKTGVENALTLKEKIRSARAQGNMKEVDNLEKQLSRLYNKATNTTFNNSKKL